MNHTRASKTPLLAGFVHRLSLPIALSCLTALLMSSSSPAQSTANTPDFELQPSAIMGFHKSENPAQGDPIAEKVNQLLDIALLRSSSMQEAHQAFIHHHGRIQRTAATVASALNYALLTRGDMPSSEAGDVILGEKLKLKSKGSTQFARQKEIDETHLQIVSSLMELSMGLGMPDEKQGTGLIDSGMASLEKLVGEQPAEETLQELIAWNENLNVPESVYKQPVWDINQHQNKLKQVLEASTDCDPVVGEISARLHKFNHHGKIYRTSSRVIETSLSIASLTPSLVGPATQIGLLAYVMATGGPEEDKLMAALYLDKRLDSRVQVIRQETQLALDKYQIAMLTHNRTLLACSQSVIRQITSDSVVQQVFGNDTLASSLSHKPVLAVNGSLAGDASVAAPQEKWPLSAGRLHSLKKASSHAVDPPSTPALPTQDPHS